MNTNTRLNADLPAVCILNVRPRISEIIELEFIIWKITHSSLTLISVSEWINDMTTLLFYYVYTFFSVLTMHHFWIPCEYLSSDSSNSIMFLPTPTAVAGVGFSPLFVCVSKSDAATVTKLDIQNVSRSLLGTHLFWSQRSRSRVAKIVPSCVFTLLRVLASFGFLCSVLLLIFCEIRQ